jgi:hypothetical protein
MRNLYYFLLSVLCFSLLTTSIKSQGQTTLTTQSASLTYNSSTVSGAIVFAIKNTNSYSIIITDVSNYLPNGLSGASMTLWSHPTITGAPAAISSANGWTSIATASISTSSSGIKPIFQNISLVLPANTAIRLAISGPPLTPYYAGANSAPNYYSLGGLEIYTQDNVNSPGYGGAFPGPPANTPRGFIGSITFRPVTAAVANNASAFAIVSPSYSFCKGDYDVKVKVMNNGNNVINNVQINWELDGVLQTPLSYSTPIDILGSAGGNEATVTLSNINFGNAARTIKVWTSLPNGVADAVPADDQVLVTMRARLAGTYAVGGAGADFANIAAAAAALAPYGICAPVTFDIQAGTYDNAIVISPVIGASATNTITFRGTGSTTIIQATTTTDDRHLVRLNGADYIILKKLSMVAKSGSTYGWGIHLTNGANYNIIDSCNIDMSVITSTTQSNSAGIIVSGSATSVTTGGSASYNTISNNAVIGAYQGIRIDVAATTDGVKNLVTGNTVRDFYADGISINSTDSTVVSFNDISRAIRSTGGTATTVVTTFAGIEMGGGNIKCRINGNKIHDTHNSAGTDQSDAAYGLYSTADDATAGSENIFSNNLIYNFNSLSGTQYGIYNSSSDGAHYFHNTIVLDNGSSTSGTVRGFYQTTTASNIQLKNNVIYVNRSGSGIKHLLYLATAGSSITSDYNVLFLGSAGASDGIGYLGSNSANLTAWRNVNNGGTTYDQHSTDNNPSFVAPASGNFTPSNAGVNGTAMGTSQVGGITTDILSALRTSNPDAGAYEWAPPLPVTLLNFSGAITGETNQLSWTTATEANNKGFELQRSIDGRNFTGLVFVDSRGEGGNSSVALSYSFNDLKPFAGTGYYRLKQYDKDGRFNYSNTVVLRRKVNETTISAVYPNPAKSELNILINSPVAAKVTVIIADLTGKSVAQKSLGLVAGENREGWDIQSLAAGSYIIKVICANGCETALYKFIKQ